MAVSRATGLYLHTKGGGILALEIVLLLTALGLAIGITTVGDPRAAMAGTATGLGIGAGLGGLAGIPSLRTWRPRWTHAGRA
jgi:hypothetical protein